MSQNHAQFTGSIPEKYDHHLGPFLFDFYARDLARRVRVPDRGRVLEVACGTGISTEQLRAALPESVEIVATDLNPAMLEHAKLHRGGLPNVRYTQADALDLPFDDAEFDAVVCQFGIMFFPDKAAGVREIARVLKPGGTFTFNVWRSPQQNTVAALAHETISGFFTQDPPTFLKVPFGYDDRAQITADLTAGGLSESGVEAVPHTTERPSARHVAVGLVEGNPGILEIQERGTAGPGEIIDALTAELAAAYGDAPLRTDLEALVITARHAAA